MNPGLPIHLFRLPGPTPEELQLLAVLLLLALLLLMTWNSISAYRERATRRAILKHRATDRAHERRLTPEEEAILVRMTVALGALPGPRSFEAQAGRLERRGVDGRLIASVRDKLGFGEPLPAQRLVSTRECAPGQDVSLTDADHAWRAGILTVDDRAITLKVPPEAATRLSPRDIVKVSFWRELDARYFFLSRVLSTSASPAPMVRLEHPARLDRFQDREFYRADVHWRVFLERFGREAWTKALQAGESNGETAPASQPPGARIEATVLDISPGGFRLAPPSDLAPDDHLLVTLPFPEGPHPLVVHARVIAVTGDGARCEFLNLTLREQDLIHHEILHQRRSRKG